MCSVKFISLQPATRTSKLQEYYRDFYVADVFLPEAVSRRATTAKHGDVFFRPRAGVQFNRDIKENTNALFVDKDIVHPAAFGSFPRGNYLNLKLKPYIFWQNISSYHTCFLKVDRYLAICLQPTAKNAGF